MTRPRPLALVAPDDNHTTATTVPPVDPWVSAYEIKVDPHLPYQRRSIKWIQKHVAPEQRRRLGVEVLWRKSHVYQWTAEYMGEIAS